MDLRVDAKLLQAAYDVAQAMKQADRIDVERLAPAGVE